jgi:hypothetical protein
VKVPGEPDRFAGEADVVQRVALADRVALSEDQIQHVRHGGDPIRELAGGEGGQSGARLAQPGLRAGDALGHGGLGDEEGAGDLCRAETAEGPQRQRDLRRRGEDRVAAEEEQGQVVVRRRRQVRRERDEVVGRRPERSTALPGGPRGVPAQLVDQAP